MNIHLNKVKAKATLLCKEFHLMILSKAVNAAKLGVSSVFFSVNTHKPEKPFQCIVSERDSWQNRASRLSVKAT